MRYISMLMLNHHSLSEAGLGSAYLQFPWVWVYHHNCSSKRVNPFSNLTLASLQNQCSDILIVCLKLKAVTSDTAELQNVEN